jgi:hypothetical protein
MKKPSTFSIRNIAFALAAALSLAILPTAQAQLIVYDGFNYNAGTVVGDNGGTGWVTPNLTGMYGASTWTDSSWQNPANVPWLPAPSEPMQNVRPTAAAVVTSPLLTYTDPNSLNLTTSGNTLDYGNKSAMRAWGVPSSFTSGSGNTLWASWLVDATTAGPSGQKLFSLPFGNAGYTPNGTNYQFGAGAIMNYTTVWTIGAQIRTSGTGGYATPATLLTLNQNQSYLIVMEFTYNGGGGLDTEQLWVDPTLGNSGPLGTDVTTGTVTGTLDLSGYWFLRTSTSTGGYIDELRIGDTYSDVVPVPEPSTLALSLIGGFMGLVVFRRRANALNPRQ